MTFFKHSTSETHDVPEKKDEQGVVIQKAHKIDVQGLHFINIGSSSNLMYINYRKMVYTYEEGEPVVKEAMTYEFGVLLEKSVPVPIKMKRSAKVRLTNGSVENMVQLEEVGVDKDTLRVVFINQEEIAPKLKHLLENSI